MSTTAEKNQSFANPFALKGKGKEMRLKTKQVTRDRRLQTRTDTDSGSEIDEYRCERFAHAMTPKEQGGAGEKFPPVKVMLVKDMPGHKDEEVYLLWDGFHTHRGAEIARLAEIDALVWEGTWHQALTAAATVANREHEKNGKPLSSKDKIHAVAILARAFKESELPKKEWPSNRQLAEMCGCSRQLVNEMDPFDRGHGDTRELTAAKKRGERAEAKKAAQPPVQKVFEVVQQSTGQVLADYNADTPVEALLKYKNRHNLEDLKGLTTREKAVKDHDEPKPGSPKPSGFDWAGMDSHLGYLIRGLDGLGDIYDLKKTPEYKTAFGAIDTFAKTFKEFRSKHGKKQS